jgi:hypothetical protein
LNLKSSKILVPIANIMAMDTVVLTEREVERLQLGGPETLDLINQAQESDAVDRLLTIREALSKYKKAVFWAMFLSTSLIMEGYDLVIVSDLDVHATTYTSALLLNSTNSRLPTLDQLLLWPSPIPESIWRL